MNDFTKDELTDLIFCVKDHTGYQGDSIHENLINKIQTMIDSYCEHEEKYPDVVSHGTIYGNKCKKCMRFV